MTVHVSNEPAVRREFVVTGVVQGVGFRPFLARLADDLELSGSCANDEVSVQVAVEGGPTAVAAFGERLTTEAPPLAQVLAVAHRDLPAIGESGFRIVPSGAAQGSRGLVPPDVAVCTDCLTEMNDPSDRRHRHPFITCTNCGPRLTIIRDLPYDRPRTTMADFPMCVTCAREYGAPQDRRFHAQPISCHECGPVLSVLDHGGEAVVSGGEASLSATTRALAAGAIVAVKGIGGFHLTCDASNATAVAELRRRKGRPDQPFAVMVRDMETAERLIDGEDAARALLTSAARPIVIAPRRHPQPPGLITDDVAPGLPHLGVMLPYAPVHHLLLDLVPALVMTSGNLSGEPLCVDNDDAVSRLGHIADLFLMHDREIHVPCEDSVIALDDDGSPLPVRRSRGYAPLPITVPHTDEVVLAAGAEIKNAPALARHGLAFVAAHVGDLGTLESRDAHARTISQLVRFHDQAPSLVVADQHPGYSSTAWARDHAAELGVPLLEVQHHHAHLAALAAEHGRLEDTIVGAVFDGTGFGCDGTIWGGEFLVLEDGGATAERVGHLATFPLPGGDGAVRNPVRTAAAALLAHDIDLQSAPHIDATLDDIERAMIPGMATTSVATSSIGRLFDVVASLLGVRHRVTYEGQAAIALEARATAWARTAGTVSAPPLPLPVVTGDDALHEIAVGPLLHALTSPIHRDADVGALAWAFHDSLARATAAITARTCADLDVRTVGLTGGVFQNRLLLRRTRAELVDAGLDVLTHRLVPPNDGGIALGQLAVGVAHGRRP